ncbi:uncharacterized protein LOC123870165 [Maniola jurtina]|uniref:uncharacterized protein LOC123870165 n=1 Tax=Maniola jurtina TaxID=191418 RepID=UPI001E687CF4|nr:uncharacterized protein LOC123870165 [Maniola jurtina]
MYRLLSTFICVLSFKFVCSLSEVDQTCVNAHKNLLDNSFLIGTWYTICNFASRLNLPSSSYCKETIIKNATKSDIKRYKEGYPLENPFNFDDNPLIVSEFIRQKGMIMGHTEAKFYVFGPENYFYGQDKYIVKVFRKVSEDYVLEHECRLRGQFRSLMSRKRHVSKEQLKRVISTMDKEVKDMETQRFCTEDAFF